MKSRTHKVVVSLTFDKKITKAQATKEFRDLIHGQFYPGTFSEAETMKIRGVTTAQETRRIW